MQPRSIRIVGAGLLIAAMAISGSPVGATGAPLLEAIRQNEVAAARLLIAQGADVKAADATGATPLMYAAAYGGPELLRLLLDRGATINTPNTFGATALMWAAPRAENVKLLLDRAADVNARASNGTTALVAAARFGNIEAMRLLLAAGADTTSPENRRNLLTSAYLGTNTTVRDTLRAAHVEVRSPADLVGPVLNRVRDDVVTLNHLLRLGVNPKEEVTLITVALPTFFMAAREGQLDALRAFVDAGVDPNHKGARGWTALMLAAAGDGSNLATLQYLLDKGGDVNARDDDGRNALDWALTRGETEAAALLRKAGGRAGAAEVVAPSPIATPRAAGPAIERAIARLQPAGPAFSDKTKCNSCHNQNIPGIAVTLAKRQGLKIDAALASHSKSVTEQNWNGRREIVMLGDTTAGGFQANTAYGLLEMAEARLPPSANSDAMVIGLARRQAEDGGWIMGNEIRPPLNGSPITSTALAIRALREFAPPAYRDEVTRRVARGREFLKASAPQDTQDRAFMLLGMIWSGATVDDIDTAKKALLALQRVDGGWAQLPTLTSDAYATGQALYALHAASVASADQRYRRGADYLLRTQLEDGTWFVRTRAFGVQAYFETGFPHGRSQFISTTATAWAAIALTYTLD